MVTWLFHNFAVYGLPWCNASRVFISDSSATCLFLVFPYFLFVACARLSLAYLFIYLFIYLLWKSYISTHVDMNLETIRKIFFFKLKSYLVHKNWIKTSRTELLNKSNSISPCFTARSSNNIDVIFMPIQICYAAAMPVFDSHLQDHVRKP